MTSPLSSTTHLGLGAARVGPDSSLTFARTIQPGNRLVVTGAAYTEGSPVLAEAGLSFWTASDELITTEKKSPFSPSATYLDFFFFADVPEATDHLTLWIRNGAGGAVTVDDIGLIYVLPSADPDPPAPETGFENDTLAPWEAGGTATLSNDALTGFRSARLGVHLLPSPEPGHACRRDLALPRKLSQ
jgi:hypothetical protein